MDKRNFGSTIWNMRLSPETPVSVKPKQEIRLTSAALGYDLNNPLGRTSIKLSYAEDHGDELDTEAGKSETFLCSLIGGYVEQSPIAEVILRQGGEYIFEAIGSNEIYLNGLLSASAGTGAALTTAQLPGSICASRPSGKRARDGGPTTDQIQRTVTGSEISNTLGSPPTSVAASLSQSQTAVPKKRRGKDKEDAVHADLRDASGSPLKPPAERLTRAVNRIQINEATSQPSSTTDNRKGPNIKSVGPGRQDVGKDKAAQPGGTGEKDSMNERSSSTDKGKTRTPDAAKSVAPAQREVVVKDKHIGIGDIIEDGKRVVCDFMIRLPDGKQVFQQRSSMPLEFVVGKGELIQGWEQNVVGMRVGGQRQLIVPPELGFGDTQNGDLPPNSIVVIDFTVLDVTDAPDPSQAPGRF